MGKIKSSRGLSFLVISLVYIAAALVGIVTYRVLPFSVWINLLIADGAATVFTFIFSVIFKNASVYDPYWSVQPIVIISAFALNTQYTHVRIFPLIAILFWGIRLTANWAYTFDGLNHQDWRYTKLANDTGSMYPFVNFIGIHMIPTLVVYGCTVPAVYLFVNDTKFDTFSLVFFIMSVAAVILQGTADVQMQRYRKNRETTFIRTGLWKHGRHPNYLGEILMWWGIGLYAVVNSGYNWVLLTGAFANTLLFLLVSIPLAEGKQSKKEGYAEYRKQTRMFI